MSRHWNHRVVKAMSGSGFYYSIREVHYDLKGKPIAFSKEPRAAIGDDLEGLVWTLRHMKKACRHPVLLEKRGKLTEI